MTVPIPPAERIEVVDILRGFALFGILLVNMQGYGWPIYLAGLQEWPRFVDRLADWAIRFFAEGKFYPLFSFLFGFGLTIQMARAEAHGARFVPLYVRRLVVLLIIGAAHALLLWVGDILVTYALLGFFLMVFRNRSQKTLIVWIVLSLLMSILLNEQSFAQVDAMDRLRAQRTIQVYAHGTFADMVHQRIRDLRFVYAIEPFFAPHVFALFLLGLYAGRRGILQDIPSHLPFVRRLWPWALGIGLVGNVLFVIAREHPDQSGSLLPEFVGPAALMVGGPALTAFYMSAIMLLVQKEAWGKRLAPLAAVGRMALSNYLLQSLVCTTIFYSYGLGLYGKVGPAPGVALTVAIYLVQIPLSVWWLRRFRFGPLEWLWRSLTYWRPQPMLIKS